MSSTPTRRFRTPRDAGLGLMTATSPSGLSVSLLPNGSIFQIAHKGKRGEMMINQVLGSPIDGGIGRLYLRAGGSQPFAAEIIGPAADVHFGQGAAGFAFAGETGGLRHHVSLTLDEREPVWFWRVEIINGRETETPFDLVLVQDVGLGGRGFLMSNEAYASQYLDHLPLADPRFGTVVMSRQNLSQGDRNPWLVQGCLDGATGYATDAIQLFGPQYRIDGTMPFGFGEDLPNLRRQHEVAAPALQSAPRILAPGERTTITFFARYLDDHPEASGPADLARLDDMPALAALPFQRIAAAGPPARSLVQQAPLLGVQPLTAEAIAARYPDRLQEERTGGELLSFFVADGAQNRHVVLAAKEGLVARRHGAILRSGQSLTLDEETLASTAWMHGVFSAQLTIGNTSFHKLFSVSRDPYGITRGSGLRILADLGEGWRLLGVPSLFEIGLSDCRWIYRAGERIITVRAIASGEHAAMQWDIEVEGPPCRFLVVGHVVLGEREFEQSGTIEINAAAKRITFRPGDDWLWGQHFPEASLHLVTGTPDAVEAIGGDELLHADGQTRGGPYVALRSKPTRALSFAVAGSMGRAEESRRLADLYAGGRDAEALLVPARSYWDHVTREARLTGSGPDVEPHSLMLPWWAQNAMIHLTVPRGLEQYTGAAWGTRDVLQGSVEFLLALRHDEAVRSILIKVFAEQDPQTGDWPQWFMLPPYSNIRAGESHGDVIVWPLKGLCDYIEATGDVAILGTEAGWWSREAKKPEAPIRAHIDKLLEGVRARFIPGTHLIRYGVGDWNDSLQPHDPHLRDWMVSSWTAGLLYEQIGRYAAILDRLGEASEAAELSTLAAAIRQDFRALLIRDGVVAGYGLIDPAGGPAELLLHPDDRRTGLSYSLIAMTQAILGGLLTDEEARHHLDLIERHLTFPDGVRLMDRPVAYAGGIETLFRRAESSSFFGREIGLMYVHSLVRHCEALALHGQREALWEAIARINPITVTQHVPQASLRQRNAYFSSSDAAFPDRYAASADWGALAAGEVAVDGGWRIYSSGPGIFTHLLLEHVFGLKRRFGAAVQVAALIPAGETARVEIDWNGQGLPDAVGVGAADPD